MVFLVSASPERAWDQPVSFLLGFLHSGLRWQRGIRPFWHSFPCTLLEGVCEDARKALKQPICDLVRCDGSGMLRSKLTVLQWRWFHKINVFKKVKYSS